MATRRRRFGRVQIPGFSSLVMGASHQNDVRSATLSMGEMSVSSGTLPQM